MIKTALSCCAFICMITAIAQTSNPESNHELLATSEVISSNSDEQELTESNEPQKDASVGIGARHPNSLASLELGDKDKGFLINRMNSEEIEFFEMSLGVAEEGMTIYNIETGKLQTWNGVQWVELGVKEMRLQDDLLLLDKSHSIDLSEYKDNTDQQNLTEAHLDGMNLTIGIENGSSVSVDLTPIFASYDERIQKLEALLLSSNENQVANDDRSHDVNKSISEARLYQNTPNPVSGPTTVKYFIPKDAESAQLILRNSLGQVISTKKLAHTGTNGREQINTSKLDAGVYYFSLFVDDIRVDTKKMVVK